MLKQCWWCATAAQVKEQLKEIQAAILINALGSGVIDIFDLSTEPMNKLRKSFKKC